MMKFSEWKPGKVIAYERAMQKKSRRGLAKGRGISKEGVVNK